MQLLTILGTGKYEETCYTWQEKQCKTRYVAQAMCEFFQPTNVTVLVTKEAQEAHWESLRQAISDRFSVKDVLIPSGKSEAEVWQIFDAVVSNVNSNSKVIFDITHAFRSIPLLVLLASAFLQKARNVEISGVYYGAFEVNRSQPPIFDLTPAIKLLDWLTATDQFINTGSSVNLGKLLSTIQQDFYRSNQSVEAKPTQLSRFAKQIEGISRSIELIRPIDLMDDSTKLQQITTAKLADEVGIFAKPFELLLSQIQQDYSQFSLDTDQDNSSEQLQKMFLLLRWYVSKKLSTQAILLGREWLVSVLCLAEGVTDYRDRSEREKIEKQLGQMLGSSPNFAQPIAKYVTDVKKLAACWSKLAEYRNDIAHAQMRHTQINATTLQNYVEKDLVQELTHLFPDMVL